MSFLAKYWNKLQSWFIDKTAQKLYHGLKSSIPLCYFRRGEVFPVCFSNGSNTKYFRRGEVTAVCLPDGSDTFKATVDLRTAIDTYCRNKLIWSKKSMVSSVVYTDSDSQNQLDSKEHCFPILIPLWFNEEEKLCDITCHMVRICMTSKPNGLKAVFIDFNNGMIDSQYLPGFFNPIKHLAKQFNVAIVVVTKPKLLPLINAEKELHVAYDRFTQRLEFHNFLFN